MNKKLKKNNLIVSRALIINAGFLYGETNSRKKNFNVSLNPIVEIVYQDAIFEFLFENEWPFHLQTILVQ